MSIEIQRPFVRNYGRGLIGLSAGRSIRVTGGYESGFEEEGGLHAVHAECSGIGASG
jgi:hypothetical protein